MNVQKDLTLKGNIVISVGYRVNSDRAIQFRRWANERLTEYMTKGFTMNDDLLKRVGGGLYFDKLNFN